MGYFATLASCDRPAGTRVLTFLESLASDMEGIEETALVADPTAWANALPRAARLVDSKAIGVGGGQFQERLCAALAGGAPSPADVFVETLARLAETQRGERDLVALLPGPGRMMANGADANGVKTALVGLVERICTSRPAMVLLDERDDPVLDHAACRRLFATLRNVADYYGVALGIRLAGAADPLAAIQARRSLRLDHLLLADGAAGRAECRAAATAAGWRSLGLGEPPAEPPATGGVDTEIWFAMTGSRHDIETLKRALASA